MEVFCHHLKKIQFSNGYERRIQGEIVLVLITINIAKSNFRDGDMEKAKETFMLSCAGYCVATYVLVSPSVCVQYQVVCTCVCCLLCSGYW